MSDTEEIMFDARDVSQAHAQWPEPCRRTSVKNKTIETQRDSLERTGAVRHGRCLLLPLLYVVYYIETLSRPSFFRDVFIRLLVSFFFAFDGNGKL